MVVEKKLKKLFEYQKFEQNERITKFIAETKVHQTAEISDDDLEIVTAAGDMIAPNESDKDHGHVYNNSL